MKYLLLSLALPSVLLASVTATAKKETPYKWVLSDTLKNPESIVYDAATKSYYVSNIDGDGMLKDGNGFISQVDESGKVIKAKWTTNLNAPKGMQFKATLFG